MSSTQSQKSEGWKGAPDMAMLTMPPVDTVTLLDAARLLKASTGFVGKLARQGEIRGCKVGRGWVFFKADIHAYLQQQIDAQMTVRRVVAELPRRRRRTLPVL